MKRIQCITVKPSKAQQGQGSNFCTNIGSDYQAFLCFLLSVLTNFFLPLAEIKKPQETTNTTTSS